MQAVVGRVRHQWQTATWTDAAWLTLCSLLFYGSKWAGKTFEGIPGHAGAFWIPTLFAARALVRRPGAASMTALAGASLWCFAGDSGSYNMAAYVAAGMALDAFEVNGNRLRRLPVALLAGALCHLAKFSYQILPALVFGFRVNSVVKLGTTSVMMLYVTFGLLGGLIGWLVMRGAQRGRGDEQRRLS